MLEMVGASCVVIHQEGRFTSTTLCTKQLSISERTNKSCQQRRHFLLFSIYPQNYLEASVLPPNSGFVHLSNFKSYYGPFAGSAIYIQSRPYIPHPNVAKRSQLESVWGIGKKRADCILEERRKKPFQNKEDCAQRTGIPITYLAPFNWKLKK